MLTLHQLACWTVVELHDCVWLFQEEEVSDDMLDLHAVIDHMQGLEDEIIEDYKQSSEVLN